MQRFFGFLAVLLLTSSAVWAQKSATTGIVTVPQDTPELRQQTFSKVWNTINEKHYDKTFGGVDWLKVRQIYEPRALAAKSLDDFHNVLRQMLGELKLSHFGIFPTDSQIESAERIDGTTGLHWQFIENRFVITRLEKDSTAEKAGLRIGFIIEKINGKAVSELLAPLDKVLADRNINERLRQIYRERTLAALIDGVPETSVRLEILNSKDEPQSVEVKRVAVKREMSDAFGNFPPQEIDFEARRLSENVGYIRFNIWVVPQMAKIRAAVREFSDAKGIIFDLRGNPGGVGGLASGVAGLLVKESFSLGSMTGRDSELKFIVYPQANPFLGKVVIVTDHGTGSTSEVFAAGMQEAGRAVIVGQRSMGAVLPSVFEILPTGATFQYAISDYKSPKNVLIEGRGVAPDFEVAPTRQGLLAGRDLQIEEAVRQIVK